MTGSGSALTSATEEGSWALVTGSLGHDVILRAFERARSAIAHRRTGHSGVFPGYDQLELAPVPTEDEAVLAVTARVVGQGEGRHTVEYVARTLHSASGSLGPVLARGVGQTLEREPSARRALHPSTPIDMKEQR